MYLRSCLRNNKSKQSYVWIDSIFKAQTICFGSEIAGLLDHSYNQCALEGKRYQNNSESHFFIEFKNRALFCVAAEKSPRHYKRCNKEPFLTCSPPGSQSAEMTTPLWPASALRGVRSTENSSLSSVSVPAIKMPQLNIGPCRHLTQTRTWYFRGSKCSND